jgi:hypothetical protein
MRSEQPHGVEADVCDARVACVVDQRGASFGWAVLALRRRLGRDRPAARAGRLDA